MTENKRFQTFLKEIGSVDFELDEDIDLSNCDREPIHIPGLIQPHGVLLALKEPELTILHASRNTDEHLGKPVESLLNEKISAVIGSSRAEALHHSLQNDPDIKSLNPLKLTINEQLFNGILHRFDELLFLELEPLSEEETTSFWALYHQLDKAVSRLEIAGDVIELCQIAAEEVRKITGLDRVMVYRFDENWNGQVISEARREDIEPYLGLYYPATDIPRQARALYLENLIRVITDIDYEPVEVVPPTNPLTEKPLDMSLTILRSISPLHVEYLQNMGVSATLGISLIKNDQLWGLIAAHHYSPKKFSYEIRSICLLLGEIVSLQLDMKLEREDKAYQEQVKTVQAQLNEAMQQSNNFVEGLTNDNPNLLDLIPAGGAATYVDETFTLIGETPDKRYLSGLVNWLHENVEEEIFYTHRLADQLPNAPSFKQTASGMLVITISRRLKEYVIWFRPEVIQTVYWGGDPHKPVRSQTTAGNVQLSPRKSFEKWKQEVKLTSLPWKSDEIEAAHRLRSDIVNVLLLQRAEELSRLNEELARSNAELDSFAYIASHDLKEPLRGLHNYATFLLEDYEDKLDEGGVAKLNTLTRLTQRMELQIESLLQYSRVGRVDLAIREVDLNDTITEVTDTLHIRLEETNTEVRVPRPLPTIECDSVRIREVYYNLVTNAMKYNKKDEKWVEVGYAEHIVDPAEKTQPLVFYVKDNGIGIRDKHFDQIFGIFKRLHGRDKYGGGTGAGLTIVQKIVQRHNGKIWVDSTYGKGTTFYFTLKATPDES